MANARICMAGWIAQRRAVPGSTRDWQWEEDRRSAILCVEAALDGVGPGQILNAHLRVVRLEAEAKLSGPWWPTVEALAAALLERRTLRGKEAERIVREALQRQVPPFSPLSA